MTNFFSVLWQKIILLMENSLFFRFINGILNFFRNFASESIFIKIISQEVDTESLENSFVYRFINFFTKILTTIRKKFFVPAFEGSFFVKTFNSLPNFFLSMNIKHILFGIMSFSISGFLVNKLNFSYLIFFVLVGIFRSVGDINLHSIIKYSLIYKLFFKITGISLPNSVNIKNQYVNIAFCIVLGILFATLKPIYALVIVVLLTFALLFIAYPYLGLLGIIVLAPFIPTMATAGLIILTMLMHIFKLLTSSKFRFRIDLLGIWIVMYMLIGLFKGVTSFAPSSSIKIALLTTLFMCVYFIIISFIDTKRKFDSAIFIFITAGFFTGLYGFYQKFSGKVDMTWVDKEIFDGLKLRVFSTFGNPNVYGEYLLILIPICFIAAYFYKNIFIKLYYLFAGVLLFANLGLTYSRGCYLGIALAVLVFILFMEKRFIALFSIGVFALPFILPDSMMDRLLSTTNLTDSSTTYRIMIWQASIRMLKSFWISGLGQGIDAYNAVYPLYGFGSVSAPHSHNLFLQIFLETGIGGLIVFVGILICFYKMLVPYFYKASENDIKKKVFSAGLMAMMAGFILQGMFDYSFYNYKVFLMFFMLLGLSSSFVKVYGKRVVKIA